MLFYVVRRRCTLSSVPPSVTYLNIMPHTWAIYYLYFSFQTCNISNTKCLPHHSWSTSVVPNGFNRTFHPRSHPDSRPTAFTMMRYINRRSLPFLPFMSWHFYSVVCIGERDFSTRRNGPRPQVEMPRLLDWDETLSTLWRDRDSRCYYVSRRSWERDVETETTSLSISAKDISYFVTLNVKGLCDFFL